VKKEMKKLLKNFVLVVVLGLLLLSAGCGGTSDYYDLSSYSPEGNGAFTSFVNSHTTPSSVASWINSNCTWQYSTSVKSPYNFWKTKVGDCSEAGALSSWCGHASGYPTFQIYITYTVDKAHRLCVWNVPHTSTYKYTSFTNSGCYWYGDFNSFAECVANWDTHTTYTVDDYVVNNWENNVVVEPEDQDRIIDRGLFDGE
jgi:hypothetical protein